MNQENNQIQSINLHQSLLRILTCEEQIKRMKQRYDVFFNQLQIYRQILLKYQSINFTIEKKENDLKQLNKELNIQLINNEIVEIEIAFTSTRMQILFTKQEINEIQQQFQKEVERIKTEMKIDEKTEEIITKELYISLVDEYHKAYCKDKKCKK